MAGIGDRDLAGLCLRAAQGDRDGARRPIGHRQAFAARRILRESQRNQLTQQGRDGGKASQHGRTRLRMAPALYRAIKRSSWRHPSLPAKNSFWKISMSERAPSSRRLEPLRHIDAGVLNVAYYEAGPAD